jgi:antitoxin ParD1/3/4
MPTQNVNITDVQAEFIRSCVEAGDYNNASELVREALRLLKAQKDEQQARVAYLRAELQEAYDARERGEYIDLYSKEDIRALREQMRQKRIDKLTQLSNASPSAK